MPLHNSAIDQFKQSFEQQTESTLLFCKSSQWVNVARMTLGFYNSDFS